MNLFDFMERSSIIISTFGGVGGLTRNAYFAYGVRGVCSQHIYENIRGGVIIKKQENLRQSPK